MGLPFLGRKPSGVVTAFNAPAINTAARFDPVTGNGIVVLGTGNRQLAGILGGEWVFWRTGHVDLPTIAWNARRILLICAAGVLAIVAAAALNLVLAQTKR